LCPQICALCGKQFTFASLVQHEKRCVATWEREQEELPASMRAAHRPALASEQMRKAQAFVEEEMQRSRIGHSRARAIFLRIDFQKENIFESLCLTSRYLSSLSLSVCLLFRVFACCCLMAV
jgi:hypothetical protein